MRDVIGYNQAGLQTLERAMMLQGDRFTLILARCNYQRLQNILIDHLSRIYPRLQVLHLPDRIPSLLDAIQIHLHMNPAGTPSPSALMITGLDHIDNLQSVLKAANLARDTYRERLSFPLVLWISDRLLAQISELAQDLKNLGPPTIRFQFPPEELISGLHREANALFNRLLQIPSEPIPRDPLIDLEAGDRLSSELESALADLAQANRPLDPDLAASLRFARARQAHSRLNLDAARDLYEQSLTCWQQHPDTTPPSPTGLEKRALLEFHLGLWWRSSATLQRVSYQSSLESARHWFETALTSFETTGKPELPARFIHALCEVLQKQQDWPTLADLTQVALTLHEQTQDVVRQARDYGFLAEIALHQQDWLTAQAHALRALDLIATAEDSLLTNPNNAALSSALAVARQFQTAWYRFLLGEAQMHLDQPQNAIALLEQARREADPQADLVLYRQILADLAHHYFEMGDYRQAFNIKLERRRVEYRNNLRAFIGAGAIQLHAPITSHNQPASAEIAASGRDRDIEALLQRLQEQRCTLIVIHGPSGVGKSSILNAGLFPALSRLTPEGRTSLPILVQTYGNWRQSIEDGLARERGSGGAGEQGSEEDEVIRSRGDETMINEPYPSPPSPLGRLRQHPLTPLLQSTTDRQRFITLLFDQFEEFFFDRPLSERQEFYGFIEDCLNLPWVKVLLTLRDDYLHYLLELERYTDITAPGAVLEDGGVLSNYVRYPLGNLSLTAAEAVIRRLTQGAQYFLEEALIHRLVHDMAAETGDVRPIELQVVGAQLQRQGITTLAAYEQLGEHPKITLVQQFVAYVVQDCGPPNEALARLVLYLLTEEDDDNRLYRPLKTREDLEYELTLLQVEFHLEQLDLVLYILVGSGLVFEIPEEPEDRYQMVHDYLMDVVRATRTTELRSRINQIKETSKTSEPNKIAILATENQALKQQISRQQLISSGLMLLAIACGLSLLWNYLV